MEGLGRTGLDSIETGDQVALRKASDDETEEASLSDTVDKQRIIWEEKCEIRLTLLVP